MSNGNSNPRVSKNQLEQMLMQSETRLNAALALLAEALRACPENEVRVHNFTEYKASTQLEVLYEKETDTLVAREKKA